MSIKNKLLIIGASSFLGEALTEKLLNGNNVFLILTCRNSESCDKWKNNDSVVVINADLKNLEIWEEIFKIYNPDKVIMLAAVARLAEGEKNPQYTVDINFWGTLNIINLCEKYNCNTFLFTSSDLARNAISTTGITKYLIERIILNNKNKKLKTIAVRIANLIDSKGSVTLIFKKQIDEGKELTVTHPLMSRRFNTREEAASDLIWLLEHGNANSVYVVNKPPEKIVDLAKNIMKEKGKNTGIRFIGAKPGEKLSEPSYDSFIINPVPNRQIALFDKLNYKNENIDDFINKLKIDNDEKEKIKSVFR